jgi:hypothetical protein
MWGRTKPGLSAGSDTLLMRESSGRPHPARSDRMMLVFTIALHSVAPAALLLVMLVETLTSGGGSALRELAAGLAGGFGILAALSVGLLALAATLFSLLAPGGLVERSY